MEFSKRDTTIFKGIAICLMLYHHLFMFPDRLLDSIAFKSFFNVGGYPFGAYLGQFGGMCMPIFVLLSGYGNYISADRHKGEDLSSLTVRHIYSLYKNVWMVFFVFVPLGLLLGKIRSEHLIRDLIYMAFGLNESFNGEWWFIVPFVILLVIFPGIYRLLNRKNASLPVDIFIVLLINAMTEYVLPEILKLPLVTPLSRTYFWNEIHAALKLVPAFMTGCILAKYNILNNVKAKLGGKPQWCILAIIGILCLVYIHLYNHKVYDFINVAVFIISVLILLPTKIGQFCGKVFEQIGKESVFIWLTHTFLCYYWFQEFIFKPKYSLLIFLLLLGLSFINAKLIRLIYKGLGAGYKKIAAKTVKA